jgi:hypothetical protein
MRPASRTQTNNHTLREQEEKTLRKELEMNDMTQEEVNAYIQCRYDVLALDIRGLLTQHRSCATDRETPRCSLVKDIHVLLEDYVWSVQQAKARKALHE